MTNSTVPARFKSERSERVEIGEHVILGAGTVVLEGVLLADGTAAGARTLFLKSSEPWTIYVGQPARKLRPRSKDLLTLAAKFEQETDDD
jgi:acetyltransferase-like isoleucine patch superfamily enzyme